MTIARPDLTEYSAYHIPYLRFVPEGTDPLVLLQRQPADIRVLLGSLTDQQALVRYAPGKWSIKESLVHLIDTERIFTYRALRIARGDQTPLPGFEQDDYVPNSGADARLLTDIWAEYEAVRKATLLLIDSFTEQALVRLGVVNGKPLSVRALIHVLAGHEAHHIQLFSDKYLVYLNTKKATD
ncbi:DinB family protein [Fibrella sp. WM1]|uniref:DinB family protein n=1 Tax=Fibrella musci TaxID=3242485 RepID=UPI003520DE84